MLKLLLVTPDQEEFSQLVQALAAQGDAEISWADSGKKALDMVLVSPVDLVVTDEKLGDMTGLMLAVKLLQINAMVNCAAVSRLSREAFHEASEGLGLLAQLPQRPGPVHAEEMLNRLRELKNITANVKRFTTI